MGSFRTDNSKRDQRCVSLRNQAQLYYDQHKQHADSCESSAKRLFAAVQIIPIVQGKILTQALGLTGGFENAVLEGGFEYHGLESVGKSMSFAQRFVWPREQEASPFSWAPHQFSFIPATGSLS